jgi:enoyl-CoA hydratase
MSKNFNQQIDNRIVTLTLDNPGQHNRLAVDDMKDLRSCLQDLDQNKDLRALILTGSGKSFCSGADLSGLGKYDFGDNPLGNLTMQLENMRVPTICALNGGVYGGGADIALSCDFRIGIRGMNCFIPPAKLGIHYQLDGLKRAVSRIGLGPSKRLFLANEKLDDQGLLNAGFLDYLVDADELSAAVKKLAEDLANLAPLSLQGMKASLNEIARGEVDPEIVKARQLVCLQSADFIEGKAALAEKRKPVFYGK